MKPAQDGTLRRRPAQQRSKERLTRILSAAVKLIERDGSDAMRMSELADMAGVSIGSLYQYFPDKAAVIRSLAEKCLVDGRDCIETALKAVNTADDLELAWCELIDAYYQMFLNQPAMRDIWSGTQADARLRAFELEDSRINGKVMADVLIRVNPNADRTELEAAAFLAMQLCEATMRLAISVDPVEGQRLVDIYKRMTARELRRAVDGGGCGPA